MFGRVPSLFGRSEQAIAPSGARIDTEMAGIYHRFLLQWRHKRRLNGWPSLCYRQLQGVLICCDTTT